MFKGKIGYCKIGWSFDFLQYTLALFLNYSNNSTFPKHGQPQQDVGNFFKRQNLGIFKVT